MSSPGLSTFDYYAPTSAPQVVKLLRKSNGQARLFMGGTDVFVRMRDGVISPELLIDLKHLPGIRQIEFTKRRGLAIGAAVNMNTLARHPIVLEQYPILAEALNSVASYQLRTRATLGGNICNASPAADSAPALLVLNANAIVYGLRGTRCLPLEKFFAGPGKTALEGGEFLLRVEIPPAPQDNAGHYLKLGRNAQGDLAIVGVAVFGYRDRKSESGYRFHIGLASVAPTPLRVPAAEAILADSHITPEVIEAAAIAAMETAKPIDDVRASAAYRQAMVKTLTHQAIEKVLEELRQEWR